MDSHDRIALRDTEALLYVNEKSLESSTAFTAIYQATPIFLHLQSQNLEKKSESQDPNLPKASVVNLATYRELKTKGLQAFQNS